MTRDTIMQERYFPAFHVRDRAGQRVLVVFAADRDRMLHLGYRGRFPLSWRNRFTPAQNSSDYDD